jgi:hypothetical protein
MPMHDAYVMQERASECMAGDYLDSLKTVLGRFSVLWREQRACVCRHV